MDIKVPSYLDPFSFAATLAEDYSFAEKKLWSSNLIVLPETIGEGSIQLFVRNDIHFYRAKWAFNEPTCFYSEDKVGQKNIVDFRVNTSGVIHSAYIEGHKKYEWEITNVDGFRMFVPEMYFTCSKNKLLSKFELYCSDRNIQGLQNQLIALSPINSSESLLLESRFLEFTHYWLDFLNNNDIRVHFEDLTPYQLKCLYDAKSILDNNMNSTPTIAELSRKVGLNTEVLKRGFRLVFELPIRQYLIKSKMEQTHYLLINTDKPIGEICQELGYSNRGHFAELYQKYYGNTPIQDRLLKNPVFNPSDFLLK